MAKGGRRRTSGQRRKGAQSQIGDKEEEGGRAIVDVGGIGRDLEEDQALDDSHDHARDETRPHHRWLSQHVQEAPPHQHPNLPQDAGGKLPLALRENERRIEKKERPFF